jgi:uncharacterized protein YdeI (YjbR/CyaY-like superfamily)
MTSIVPYPSLHVSSSREWRKWLQQNNSNQTEIWLEIRKKGSTVSGISYDDALNEALCFGWIDGKMKSMNKDMYVLRFSPRRKNSIWSMANRQRAESLVAAGRMRKSGLAAIEQARANGRWSSAYSSKVKPDTPSDLEQRLSQNPQAWRNFQDMAISYQTMYIQWILDAKRPQTRSRRIAEVVRRAQQNIRPGI